MRVGKWPQRAAADPRRFGMNAARDKPARA